MSGMPQRTLTRFLPILQVVLFLPVGFFLLSRSDPLWSLPTGVLQILRLVGIALLTGAMLLMGKALGDLGKAFQPSPAPRVNAKLVTSGIYAHLRHPMYTGMQMILVGALCLSPSWWMVLCVGANFIFYGIKARYEEGLLARKYADYPAYMAQTRGVWPF